MLAMDCYESSLTLRVSRAAGSIVEQDKSRAGKSAKVAPRSEAAPAASCCTRLLGFRKGESVDFGSLMRHLSYRMIYTMRYSFGAFGLMRCVLGASRRDGGAQRTLSYRFCMRHFELVRCALEAFLARRSRAKGGRIPLQYAAFRADEMRSRRTPRARYARKRRPYSASIRGILG